MDKDSACFPLIPASTSRAARTLYGRGNVYLRLGDRLNDLISKFDLQLAGRQWGLENALLLALLTIIQYVEKMTDAELSASIQQRMDLRYAVHLATPSPRLDPRVLCVFRSRLLSNPEGLRLFQEIFQAVYAEIATSVDTEQPTIDRVLDSICENEVRASLMDAMLRTVEFLSANHFDWLRQVALPHWYQRYNRSTAASFSPARQELTREEIQRDIRHLLAEIHATNSPDMMGIHEIQDLGSMWEELTYSKFIKDCNHCIRKKH
jgi:hypothetical protein